MALDLALLCLDVVTIAALLLIGGRIAAAHPRRPESWLAFLLCVSVAAHVALARAEYGPWTPPPYRFVFGGAATGALDVIRNTAPALFALLARMVFTDHRPRVPSWLTALIAIQLMVEIAPQVLGGQTALDALSALLHVVFTALAVVWTLADWQSDLIEERRRTRALMVILLAVDGVATSVLLRLVIPQGSPANYQGHVVLTAVTCVIVIFVVWRMMAGDAGAYLGRRSTRRRSVIETREREDDQTLTRLRRLLTVDHVHLEPRLSLARLAARLGTPEYRLRRLIHERLGFRNFNAFLHDQRIRSAAEQLADPAQRRTPILTIALSCGYESVNTFNRGFREVMGLRPSEYRAQRLASPGAEADSPSSA